MASAASRVVSPPMAIGPNTIGLVGWVVGMRYMFAVFVQPTDTIASMLQQFKDRLVEMNEPHEFDAYSSVQDGQWRFSSASPDFYRLRIHDQATRAKYLTGASWLDPTKLIADYFLHAERRGIHVLLDWSSASWKEHKARWPPELSESENGRLVAEYCNTTVSASSLLEAYERKRRGPSGVIDRPVSFAMLSWGWDAVSACLPSFRAWKLASSATHDDAYKKNN